MVGRDTPDEVITGLIHTLVEMKQIRFDDGFLALPDHTIQLRKQDEANAGLIWSILQEAGLNTPLPKTIAGEHGLREEEVRRLIRALKLTGRVVILDERVAVTVETFQAIRSRLVAAFPDGVSFSIGEAAEALGSTRKYIVPLFEYLDTTGFTQREKDRRRIVR